LKHHFQLASKKGKHTRSGFGFGAILIVVEFFVLMAGIAILVGRYVNTPIVDYWRNLYIETAMTTKSHQWLATSIFSEEQISSVVTKYARDLADAEISESTEKIVIPPRDPITAPVEDPTGIDLDNAALLKRFPELDPDTVPEDWLQSEDLDVRDIAKVGVQTTCGDKVWAIDYRNGILIVEITGPEYKGKLAIVRDPSMLDLELTDAEGYGRSIEEYGAREGVLLAINASGFYDPEGTSPGDTPSGLVIADGIERFETAGNEYQAIGIDYDNCLRIGKTLPWDEIRDAVEFYPCLIANGEKNAEGTMGMGIQPRTALGQTADGTLLMLVIDGRQPTHSIGAAISDCREILYRYHCWNAENLDGGSSSIMWYKGSIITSCSSSRTGGRLLPNAWVIKEKPAE